MGWGRRGGRGLVVRAAGMARGIGGLWGRRMIRWGLVRAGKGAGVLSIERTGGRKRLRRRSAGQRASRERDGATVRGAAMGWGRGVGRVVGLRVAVLRGEVLKVGVVLRGGRVGAGMGSRGRSGRGCARGLVPAGRGRWIGRRGLGSRGSRGLRR